MNGYGQTVREKEKQVFQMLALELRGLFEKKKFVFEKLQEIRMRVGMPLLVVYDGREYAVSKGGDFTPEVDKGVRVLEHHIRETMEYVSNYSMYAFEEEIRQGYLTVAGGHRVGLAGKVVFEKNSTKCVRYISFLNIRLAHEIKGCAKVLLPFLYWQGKLCHTLIISPPGCGKTTLLRDLVRQVSNGDARHPGMAVGVVDERSELGACYRGKPQNDLGCRTDVLDGCPKSEGMMMLVRSMSPKVIAVDEIGSQKDAEAVEYIMNSGVCMLATVHASSVEELGKKPALGALVKKKRFERYVVLNAGKTGEIAEILDAGKKSLTTFHTSVA